MMCIINRILSILSIQSDNGDPDEVQLDAEMEKVFAGSDKDKFNMSQITAGDQTATSPGRKVSSPATGGDEGLQSPPDVGITVTRWDPSDPLVSERASKRDHDDDDEDEERRHVKFDKPGSADKPTEENDEDRRRRKARSQHYKQRKYSLPDANGNRKQSVSVQAEDADLQVKCDSN